MAADANKQANKIALADTKPLEPPRRLVEEGESIFTTIPLHRAAYDPVDQ